MRKAIIGALIAGCFTILSAGLASADQYVHGYTRQNGTYVQPYMRSSPDSSYNNNYSVSPNVNPYTGQQGTRSPTYNDRSPSSNQPAYGTPNYGTPSYGMPGQKWP
jgi:hypothetical protein